MATAECFASSPRAGSGGRRGDGEAEEKRGELLAEEERRIGEDGGICFAGV